MEKIVIFQKHIGRSSIYFVLSLTIVFALCSTGWTQDAASNVDVEKQKTAAAVVNHLLQAGLGEYQQGLYEQAEKTLSQAIDYRKYLDSKTQDELDKLLNKARTAKEERNRILEAIRQADQLVKDNKLFEARAKLDAVRYSEYINAEERDLINEGVKKLDVQIGSQRKDVAEIYNQSVDLYNAGELEKAREGFVKVVGSTLPTPPDGHRAEDYIAKIDAQLAQKAPVAEKKADVVAKGTADILDVVPTPAEAKVPVEVKTTVELNAPAETAAATTQGTDSYIEKVIQKTNVVRGHTKAVVRDANEKATAFINSSQFDNARSEIENAQRLINENQFQLGKDIYKEYNDNLSALRQKVAAKEQEKVRLDAQQREVAAAEAQGEFRKNIEKEKTQRVAELLDRARDYQKQQRYEESLGQLDSLLLIEPTNNEALLLKQTLDDIVSFRKQLEVQKEKSRERVGLLRETDRSTVPYEAEMTHPKNWQEIIEKPTRQPKGIIGEDKADKETYDRLDKTVDLPKLSPLMTLSAAIDEIRDAAPGLKIVVNWRDLKENADVDEQTPIKTDAMLGVPLKAALMRLLEGVSGGNAKIGYIVEGGIITIATEETLSVITSRTGMKTFMYDITDLAGKPANFMAISNTGMSGMGGSSMGGGGMGGSSMGGSSMGGSSMGGSSMGGGGMGGSSMGGGGMGGGMGGYDTTWENESMKLYRMYQLGQLIRRTISPGTWNLISTDQLGTGGMGGGMGQTAGGNVGTAAGTTGNEPAETTNDPTKGTIEFYQGKYMVVRHTIDVQKQIEKLLNDMRVALGEQVSIEARFLIVGENFLEDLGVDVDIKYNRTPGLVQNEIDFDQTSSDAVQPQTAGTKVPGNLGGTIASVIKGGSGNIMQDNLQVDFIIRATQAHRDSLILTAPKITVLSGETAALSVTTYNQIAMPPITGGQTNYIGGTSGSSTNTNLPQYQTLVTGPQMTITPIISQDKKHVLLNISTTVNDFLGMQQLTVQTTTVNASGTITPVTYTSSLPQTETTTVQTRVSVPDGGTLLFGGLKITAEEEVEVGVPILSKIPILGRAFDNRSKIKDNKILLILVKPTIILQKEKDAEAVSALELPSGI